MLRVWSSFVVSHSWNGSGCPYFWLGWLRETACWMRIVAFSFTSLFYLMCIQMYIVRNVGMEICVTRLASRCVCVLFIFSSCGKMDCGGG